MKNIFISSCKYFLCPDVLVSGVTRLLDTLQAVLTAARGRAAAAPQSPAGGSGEADRSGLTLAIIAVRCSSYNQRRWHIRHQHCSTSTVATSWQATLLFRMEVKEYDLTPQLCTTVQ